MTVQPVTPQPGSPIQDLLGVVAPLRELIDIVWWTDAVPRSYKWSRRDGDFPELKVKALMLASALLGNAMGVDPFRSWANIHPTGQGRFAIAADFKVGLALAAGCEMETVKRSPEECIVRGRRRGGEWQEVRLTIADARQAGWTSNNLYDKVPGDMLYHRASARLADMLAAHVTLGIVTYEDYADLDREQDVRGIPDRPVRQQIEAAEPRRSPVAELIQRSPDADRRLADVVERDKHPQVPETMLRAPGFDASVEDAPAPAETPTERVRQRRSAEKLGLGEDDGGDGMAWVPDEKHGGRVIEKEELPPRVREALYPEERVTREQALRNQEGTGVLVPTVEVVEATPEEWAEVVESARSPEERQMLAAAGTAADLLGGVVVDEYPEDDPDAHETEPVEEIPDDPATWPQATVITTQSWNEINDLFNKKHGVNGTGSRAARYRVIKHVTGKTIEKGSDLTAAEGDKVLFFLNGTSPEVVKEIAYKEES